MAKTLSFAATHFTVAFGVAYALTGDVVIGGALALVEPAVNTVAYHFHEKVWRRIQCGNGIDVGPPAWRMGGCCRSDG